MESLGVVGVSVAVRAGSVQNHPLSPHTCGGLFVVVTILHSHSLPPLPDRCHTATPILVLSLGSDPGHRATPTIPMRSPARSPNPNPLDGQLPDTPGGLRLHGS